MRLQTAIWLLGIAMLPAQETPAAADPKIDLEARRASVTTLRQHIAMREKRLDEVKGEIKAMAEKTNARIDEAMAILTTKTDSESSRQMLSMVKGEAAAGLKRMIDTYQYERRNLLDKLAKHGEPTKDLEGDLAIFDKLIEKRADQIVALIRSIPGGQDVPKYEGDGGYWDGFQYYDNSRISETWRQNRRDRVQSEKMRREAQEVLKKAIGILENKQRALASEVNGGPSDGPEREIKEQELAQVEGVLAQRKRQLLEVTLPSDGAVEDVSKDQAADLKSLFEDVRRDVAADFQKTLQLYRDAAAERQKVRDLQENLAAREKWLSENDPASKKSE